MTEELFKPSRGRLRDQSVYIYEFPNGRVKVGRAVLPGTRKASVQKEYRGECELAWHSDPHPRASAIESLSHAMLAGLRAERWEMFRCSVALAKRVVQSAIAVQNAWLRENPEWLAQHTAKRQEACAEYNAWRRAQGRWRHDSEQFYP